MLCCHFVSFVSVLQYLQKLKGWRAEMVLINSRIFLDIIFESIPVEGDGGGACQMQ